MAVFICQQQLAGARGGETSTSKSASLTSTFPLRRVPRCSARGCSTARLFIMVVSSPTPQGLSAAAEGSTAAVEAAIASAAMPKMRVVVATATTTSSSLPPAIVVEPSTGGNGGDGQLPPSEGGDGFGDGDGGDGRRKFFRFNLIAG